VAAQGIVGPAGQDQVGNLRREKPLHPRKAFELRDAFGDALLQRAVPACERLSLRLHLVVERFDSKQ
jgi:hypothetical protein